MGDEKLNNVDELHNSEETRYQCLSNETICCTGITGVGTVDVPLNVLSNYPSFRMEDVSLAGTNGMRSAPHLDSYQSFSVHPHLLNRVDYIPSQYSPLEKIYANSEYLQTAIQDIKMDDGKPQSLEVSTRGGSREHLLRGAEDGGEMVSIDNLVDCVVQSNYPESLDGSFLTLGVGVDREARSNYNNGALSMQLNQSHSQSGYGSSFAPDFKMAAGLSDIQTYAAGLSCIEENAVESYNASPLTGSSQNVDSCTFSTHDFSFVASNISNLSSNSSQMLPIPQRQVQHPFLSSGNPKFISGFANIDPNKGFPDLYGISSNGEHIRTHSGLLPNQSFHTLSGSSSIAHSCSQSVLPFQGQQRLAPWTSSPSFVRNKYAAATSDQVQNCDSGSILSLQRGTSAASVLGNIGNTNNQSDQPFAGDRSASQVGGSSPFSKNVAVQTATKDKLSVADRNTAEVVSLLPSSNNIGFQEANSLGQYQNNAPIQASNNLVPAYTSGQVIPFAGRNGPATTSNNPSRSSLKRKATQPPAATPRIKIKRIEKSSSCSSAVGKAQNAPYIHVPSVVHPITTVPPVRVTPQPPVQATTIPVSATRFLSPHIKWQDADSLQPSGYNCLLCKRDLSYSPEGPILPLTAPPPVAVLSCGHCFHDLCLQRMTPKDQANNPPCIPCVIGES